MVAVCASTLPTSAPAAVAVATAAVATAVVATAAAQVATAVVAMVAVAVRLLCTRGARLQLTRSVPRSDGGGYGQQGGCE